MNKHTKNNCSINKNLLHKIRNETYNNPEKSEILITDDSLDDMLDEIGDIGGEIDIQGDYSKLLEKMNNKSKKQKDSKTFTLSEMIEKLKELGYNEEN